MAKYWLSFRISDSTVAGKTYSDRLNALESVIDDASSKKREETTSFILFESESNMDRLCLLVKSAIAGTHDVVLIGGVEVSGGRVIGKNEYPNTLASLFPHLKSC